MALAATIILLTASTASEQPLTCDANCKAKQKHERLEHHYTPYGRWAIPGYIVSCESHGNFRAYNSASGAGGAYQVMPSTWGANLPKKALQRFSGGNQGPRWSSKLLQHIVAYKIWHSAGASQWSCA